MSSNPARAPISAFIIAYNEEANIGACIDSLSFCDEVLVIDSFSNDRTPELAREKGARVIQREWPGHRQQKAFGLEQAEHAWVLNIDADERVTAELKEGIIRVLTEAKEYEEGKRAEAPKDGYEVNRLVWYLDRWWKRGGWYPEWRLRLVQKSKARWGGLNPHEKAIVDGPTERLPGDLEHHTYTDLSAQFRQLEKFSSISANEIRGKGRRFHLLQLFTHPLARFVKFYFLKGGWREGIAGFIVAVAETHYAFMKYAKLWEIEFWEKSRKRESDED